MPVEFSSIESLVQDFREGKAIVLIDEETRENEGDIIVSAEKITAEMVNFMAKYGRGLICLAITPDRADILDLPFLPSRNQKKNNTAFTLSIEAKEGITTGISAADRAKTILDAVDPQKGADDIATPGHIFPVVAKKNGVLERRGHTEAGVDFAKLAGLIPAAVICEIMNDDGTMARLSSLLLFAKTHNLKIGRITDLIEFVENKKYRV